MENGKIIQSGLKKSKLDINDFLAEARTQGYFDLNEIDTAIMEINGSISFLLKEKDKPSNKSDVNAKLSNSGIPANVIIDSNYMENNMEAMGKGIHSLLISCMRYIVLILPLAFIFSHFFGVNGVWHAFWITEAVTSVIAAYVYHKAAGSRK